MLEIPLTVRPSFRVELIAPMHCSIRAGWKRRFPHFFILGLAEPKAVLRCSFSQMPPDSNQQLRGGAVAVGYKSTQISS